LSAFETILGIIGRVWDHQMKILDGKGGGLALYPIHMYFSLDHLVWGGHDFGYACLTKLKKLSENESFQMHVGRDPPLITQGAAAHTKQTGGFKCLNLLTKVIYLLAQLICMYF
jgi:hypothetical protein